MRKYNYIILTIFTILFFNCNSDKDSLSESISYKINQPIVMDAATFRRSIIINPIGKDIKERGKIGFYGNIVYINEPEKGIHIYDNKNPEKPINIGFIELIGNTDFIIHGTILYSNAFIDMVWFDLSNPAIPKEKGRMENIFKSALPRINNEYGYLPQKNPTDIVVGWKLIDMSQNLKDNITKIDSLSSKSLSKDIGNNKFNSILSRFGNYGDYIYIAIDNNLHIFLNNNRMTEAVQPYYIGQEPTSIFIANNFLYVSVPSGLLIYSLNDPTSPKQITSLPNVYQCNPIATQGNMAFFTIQSGNACQQTENALLKMYLSDEIQKPENFIEKYAMTKPKGLAFIGEQLFVSDDGLKIFNPYEMNYTKGEPIYHNKNIVGDDIIPIEYSRKFILIKKDGLYQYDATDIFNIKQLSKINTNFEIYP